MRTLYDLVYAPELGEFGKLDLYLPDSDDACPLFIYFHGGGIVGGNRKSSISTLTRLAENGVAVASVEYRLYQRDPEKGPIKGVSITPEILAKDSPQFPDFIEDCAASVAWLKANIAQYHTINSWYIGGSSAGGYLTMMLFFDTRYLEKHGIDARTIDGYLFDAGQPTVHFNVLAARGEDDRLIRVDEAAPIYFADASLSERPMPKVHIIYADQDMYNRPEQTCLLYRTMLHFKYDEQKLRNIEMKGYRHCGYCGDPLVFGDLILDLIRS